MTEYQFRFGTDPPLSVTPGDDGMVITGGGVRGQVVQHLLTLLKNSGYKACPPSKSVELVELPIGAPIAALLSYAKIRNIVGGDSLVTDVVRERDLATASVGARAWIRPVADVLTASNVGAVRPIALEDGVAPDPAEEFDTVVASMPEDVQASDSAAEWVHGLAVRVAKTGAIVLEVATVLSGSAIVADAGLLSLLHERFGTVDPVTPRIGGPDDAPPRQFYIMTRPYRIGEKWHARAGTSSVVRISPDRRKVFKERPPAADGKGPTYEGAFEREVFWLTRLAASGYTPAPMHIDPGRRLIVTNWAGPTLEEISSKSPRMFPGWLGQLVEAISDLQRVGCVYDDVSARRVVVRAFPPARAGGASQYQLALLGFGRCPMQLTDSTCGGEFPPLVVRSGPRRTFSDILQDLAVGKKLGTSAEGAVAEGAAAESD